MKKVVLFSSLVLGVLVVGGSQVNAAEEVTGNAIDSTPTTITIKDSDTEDKDIDWTKPQNHLYISEVPGSYSFESTVTGGDYSLSTTNITGVLGVTNDKAARNWQVKAEVAGNSLSEDNGSNTFTVDSFKIDNVETVTTGSDGIVFKNADNTNANTGKMDKQFGKLDIAFKDTNKVLKAGSVLKGSINYKLYNTSVTK